ncbi:hypothetical protein CVT26_004930 [Gymnopilus dilepis]|uniref:Uncharacterized protein n=1 Tax=Gymnopilus dilepis TaxID=231916 RepID=A0A409X641_9AGAR|nr:hypothetical protein CVT26_004930 [Gymnopilus dilepis]
MYMLARSSSREVGWRASGEVAASTPAELAALRVAAYESDLGMAFLGWSFGEEASAGWPGRKFCAIAIEGGEECPA